ncbi:MAG TPA: NADH:flavin oxidoreductase [Phycisphaerae bacterium]|nr:NADH:flavin oxidoreductase [Phycisphaerae bacterium]
MSQHEKFKFASAAELLDKIRSLNVDIPFTEDLGPLWRPIEIAGRQVPNRLAIQPMEGSDADEVGGPSELSFRRYRRFAASGSGLIWFEATAVLAEARSNSQQLHPNAANVGAFGRLVEATRRAAREGVGPEHQVLCILQLTHPGRYCREDGRPRPVIAQHNAVLDPAQGLTPDYLLITDAELDRLQDGFVRAAALASQAGFDGVDIKACHGYLVSELLASHTREGKYGGTFENRARFLLETVQRIRDRLPGFIVTSRISGYDGLPHPYGFGGDPSDAGAGGFEEARELASRLVQLGCPLANVSIGNPHYQPHLSRPFDRPVAGQHRPDEHPLVGVARLLRITGALQQAVPTLPMVGTGYSWLRQFFPYVGAAIVRDAKAAFVGIGRMAFAYPDCVKDLALHGKLDPAKVCLACSSCTQIMRDGGRAGCVLRDQEIYAAEYQRGRRRAHGREDRAS